MDNIKERLIGAITVMSDAEAQFFWNIIEKRYKPKTWDDIEEVIPDETDLQMLHEAEDAPECHEFVSREEADRILKELLK